LTKKSRKPVEIIEIIQNIAQVMKFFKHKSIRRHLKGPKGLAEQSSSITYYLDFGRSGNALF
jgi:hypothetical protein